MKLKNPIHELVKLKSKIYLFKTLNNKEIKKAKGVNKNVVGNIRQKIF